MTCPNCRYESAYARGNCEICGVALPTRRATSSHTPTPRPAKAGRTAKVIWIILVILALAGAAYAQNVMEPADGDGYYEDTPMVCGQGRC